MRLARNLQHILQRVEHLHRSAQFRAIYRVTAAQPLVACPQPRRVAYRHSNGLLATMQILDERTLATALIVDGWSLESVRHIDRMSRK